MNKTFHSITAITLSSFLLLLSCSQKIDNEIYDMNFNLKPSDISGLTITPDTSSESIKVELNWTLPPEQIQDIEIVCYNDEDNSVFYREKISRTETSWTAYNLDADSSYRFVLYTKNSNDIKSNGASITFSYANSDLVGYKSTLLAYDFGYTAPDAGNIINGSITNKFKYKYPYNSKYSIDISDLSLNSVCGNPNAYKIVDFSPKFLEPGTTCEIEVSYTPDYGNKTWDEAEFIYGGSDKLNVCLIGSTFKQPRNINPEHLRLWLRPDFITSSNINNNKRCTLLPDFSGNRFDAKIYTHLQSSTSENAGPVYIPSKDGFNNLPVLHFTDGVLRSSGKICIYSTADLNNNTVLSKMGTTAFIAYKPEDVSSSFFMTCYNGYSTSFPYIGTISRNWDTENGYNSSAKYHPAVMGNGQSTGRFFYKKDFNGTDLANGKFNTPVVSDQGSHLIATKSVYRNYSSTTSNTHYKEKDSSKHLYRVYGYYNAASNNNWLGVPYENSIEAWYDGTKYDLAFTGSVSKTTDALSGVKIGESSVTRYATGEPWGKPDNSNEPYPYLSTKKINEAFSPKEIIEAAHTSSSYNNPSFPSYCSYFNNNIVASPESLSIKEVYLGKSFTSTSNSKFFIADVIIYNESLSDNEIAEINNYIYYRWGIGKAMQTQ